MNEVKEGTMTGLIKKIYKVNSLSEKVIEDMYKLFIQYYDFTPYDKFRDDLRDKDSVIIARDKDEIVGFATGKNFPYLYKGKKIYIFYNGDVIVDRKYWGKKILNPLIVKYVLDFMIRHPFDQVFSFILINGYKTYLTFDTVEGSDRVSGEHTPCYNKRNKELEGLNHSLAKYLFSNEYNETTGLVDFGPDAQRLRGGVAEITDEMRESNPRIAFFEKINPTWKEGTEIPTLKSLSLVGIVGSILNIAKKKIIK